MDLKVIHGDLFEIADAETSLAHCVSSDYRLSKGIAKSFREKFGRIRELEESGTKVGGVATLKDNNRFIYNLVTKVKCSDKGDYHILQKSLEAMREHAEEHKVKKIAMPKIGCGLDRLSWPAVRTIIKNVFRHNSIQITVCHLDAEQLCSVKRS